MVNLLRIGLPPDTLYEEENLDNAPELLAEFMNAYQRGDFETAREYADSLNSKYPGSLYAQRANEFLSGLDSDLSSKRIAEKSSSKSANIRKASNRTSTPRKTRTRTKPKIDQRQLIRKNEARLKETLGRLRVVRDNQQQITWHYNKNVSHYVYKTSLEAYIGKNDAGDVWLRMRIYYTGGKPLNIESYEVNVVEKDYSISTLYGSMERGRGSAGAWEWYDAQVSTKDLSMLRNIAKVGQTEIRYIGRSGLHFGEL